MSLDLFTAGPLRTLLRLGGIDITWRCGDVSAPVRLMPADQDNPHAVTQGFVRQWSERDWLGLLADLVLDSELVIPEAGHQIVVGDVAEPSEIWEVRDQSNGQCWEPLAANREGFRVHTIRIA